MCMKRTGLERMKIKRKREAGRGNKTKVVQCDLERKENLTIAGKVMFVLLMQLLQQD